MALAKKIVVELRMYSDGDWGYDESMFDNYTSKYFENDLYEYTVVDDYTTKIRRVFDYSHTGLNELCEMLAKIRNSTYGRCSDEPNQFIDDALCVLYAGKKKIDRNTKVSYSDYYDSNTELEISVYSIATEARPIKKIIYGG